MPEAVLFDALQVELLLPTDVDEPTAAAAHAVLDAPEFLARVRTAVAGVLAAVPATAVLSVSVEW